MRDPLVWHFVLDVLGLAGLTWPSPGRRFEFSFEKDAETTEQANTLVAGFPS